MCRDHKTSQSVGLGHPLEPPITAETLIAYSPPDSGGDQGVALAQAGNGGRVPKAGEAIL